MIFIFYEEINWNGKGGEGDGFFREFKGLVIGLYDEELWLGGKKS